MSIDLTPVVERTRKDRAHPNPEPIVLLDCDGVLADFLSAALRIVYEVTGDVFSPDQVTEFDFCAALGLSEHDGAEVKREIGAREGFAAGLKPIAGAREGVALLQQIAQVYVVTSPWNSNATWMHEREAWLWRWFRIPHANVLHASAKHLVAGDFLVDDKASTVRTWPHGTAILWDAPHNQLEAWSSRRTSSWTEVADLVRRIGGLARVERGLAELRGSEPIANHVHDWPGPFDLGGEAG